MEQQQINKIIQQLCKECQSFYGSHQLNGLCSTCFKKQNNNQKQQNKNKKYIKTEISKVQFIRQNDGIQEIVKRIPKKSQKDRKKCFSCNKKLGLLGIQCKCGLVFCNDHRLPEHHNCQFDPHKNENKKQQLELKKVQHKKIQQI